jgi:uncharacterized membrane protein
LNSLINLLEAIDKGALPTALLIGLIVATAWFIYRWYDLHRTQSGQRMKNQFNQSDSANAEASISALRSRWVANRNYKDTLSAGPIMVSPHKGWFGEEVKICSEFRDAKAALEKQREARKQEHPIAAENYLNIVGESNRKPHSSWVFSGLLLLMAVEATGFSLIFADNLSDTASAQMVQRYAYMIAGVIAVVALLFAHWVGMRYYKQGYARTAHLLAPGQALERKNNRGLTLGISEEHEKLDEDCDQSTRKINRSDFVNALAGVARSRNELIPHFPNLLWVYVAVVFIFGVVVGGVRLAQIDDYYSKQLKAAQAIANADADQTSATRGTRPPAVEQSSRESGQIITQESMDAEKRGKQLAILVFVLIFYIVQVLGVALSASRGFASEKGYEAFRKIEDFKERYGDISQEAYMLQIQAGIDEADRYAQETLQNWQLGLQTAFAQKAMPVPHEEYFKDCVTHFDQRTYENFLAVDKITASASTAPVASRTESRPSLHDEGAQGALSTVSDSIDFFVISTTGNEEIRQASLAELKRMLGDAELSSAGLMVRRAGMPGAFEEYAKFVRGGQA